MYGTEKVPAYASPARETNYKDLPPCYTFVCDGEPFYCETLTYIKNLQEAGVQASVDVFKGNVHAFDMFFIWSKKTKQAKQNCANAFEKIISAKKN